MSSKQNLPYYGRFKGMPWFTPISNSVIMVCGQGGIGSHLTFFLARTGAELVTVDYDTVEDHNIAGQLYGKEDVDKTKVDAMVDIITRLCGEVNITPLNSKIESGKDETAFSVIPHCDVVCVSFDNIATRRIVFENWAEFGKKGSLFIDGRMSIEQGNVFTVEKESPPEVFKHYRESCFDDSELPEAACTVKATTHCGSLIASLMVAQITNWFNNKTGEGMPRTVVNQLNFNLPLFMFEEVVVEPEPITEEVCSI